MRYSRGFGQFRFRESRWQPARVGHAGRGAGSTSSRNLASIAAYTAGCHELFESTLWGRLRTHRGGVQGGGNHRGSVFRRHVGQALLARESAKLSTWGEGSSTSSTIRASEALLEQEVSKHLGGMSVLWLEVPDNPGPQSARAYIGRNAIALLSNGLDPIDKPSARWLGFHSPHHDIRSSGLWNLDHVRATYESVFLNALESFVRLTCRRL